MLVVVNLLRTALAATLGLATIGHGQGLPDRVLVGYWHNWTSTSTKQPLRWVPPAYDVVNVSFAIPATRLGADMRFTPSPSMYTSVQAFVNDVRALQAKGKKVLISIGGGADPVHLDRAADVQTFVTSMLSIIRTYGFDGMDIDLEGSSLTLSNGDRDFRKPTSPRIVNVIAGVRALLKQLPASFLLTAAPETAFVQGGYGTYAGIWGAYLPVLHALRDRLTFVHVQHYNSGSMYGRDGNTYRPATADFHVAMADSLLAGFPVDRWGLNLWFPPLDADQVAIGLPASTRAAGNGYTAPNVVHGALDYVILGKPTAGTYRLSGPGFPRFRGLMTWSINWDVEAKQAFSTPHRRYFDSLFLRASSETVRETGGSIDFTLRAGCANAHRSYLLLAGVTGTQPGTPLPGGRTLLPLNLDPFTLLVLDPRLGTVFRGFTGWLDAQGSATARLSLPPVPGLRGLRMDYAFTLPQSWGLASNPRRVTIVP